MEIDVEDAFAALRLAIFRDYAVGRERSIVLTKIEEAEMWLSKCIRDKT